MKFFLYLCCSIFFFNCAHGQAIDSNIRKFSEKYASEKTWLHYDKSSYFPGETIWFKAYLMSGISPALESKTLYVDWVGDNGAVLSHHVSPLVDAITNGQFEIPSDYKGNFIHVRAYTKWMMNFDTAFLYNKDIRILNKTAPVKTAKPGAITSLDFFPEGGDAVAGVNNRIAFKANDQWGRPVSIRGIIIDNNGKTIDSFHSVHDGMGSFNLVPMEGSNYSTRWTDAKGEVHNTPLNTHGSAGVSIQVNGDRKHRIVTINSSKSLPENLKSLHLIGTLNQQMAFKADISVSENSIMKRIIPTQSFPSGILTITLFDANWNAVAERISFINNNDYSFQPTMEVLRWGLSKRKRNEIKISVPEGIESSSLSVSVTDAAVETDSSSNIISHFLLSSELKGQVYNPAYYFSDTTDLIARHLDLVMMTHGWRRFKWEDVVNGKSLAISYPKDTSYLILSGKVFGVTKAQLSGRDNIVLILKEKDSTTKMILMPIQTNGNFSDPGIVLFDTVQVYYSLKSKLFKEAEAKFMTDRLPAPNYVALSKNFIISNPFSDTTGTYHHIFLASEKQRLLDLQKGQVMENVTIKTRQKTPVEILDEKYAGGLFKNGDGYQFDLVNDALAGSYTSVLQYLQGKVAGLMINTGGESPSLSWRGGTPQLFLDEMQTDVDLITNVPVSDIAYVKVFRPPFLGASGGGAGGAIAIYTRKGSDATQSRKGLTTNKIAGYTPIRQFYSPNYDSFDPRNEQPDLRTTIYWNPLVSTTQNKHSVVLSFYNSDVTKSFRVVIEGMTREGLLTHYEQVME